jgi:hypothetical protein
VAEHGTRTNYVKGCRCEPCTLANRVYERERDRHARRVAYGIEVPQVRFVNAKETREHLIWLQSIGIGLRTVAKETGLGRTALTEIRKGITRRVAVETEAKILALHRGVRHGALIVDAAPTLKRLDWLQGQGWSKARIARELGYSKPALQFRTDRITVRSERRVEHLVKRVLVDG